MAKISGRWATAASVLSIGALLGVATTLPASAAPIPVPSVSATAEDDATTPTVDPSTTPTDQTQPSEGSETETGTSTPSPEVSTTPTTPAAPEEPAEPSNVAVPTEDEAVAEDEGEEEGTEPQHEYEEGPWGDYGLTVVPNWFFNDTNGNGLLDVGETYGVTFQVTNITDLDLTNLTLNPVHPSYPWDTPGPSVAAGETVEITRTDILSQYYFDYSGHSGESFNNIIETWIVRGISANNKGVLSAAETHRFPVPELAPSLATNAVVTSKATPKRVGDVITYSVAAKNAGNTTLATPVLASPAQTTAGTGFRNFNPDVERGILPQATETLTGSYVVTKADVARGVVNISLNATSQSHSQNWVLSPAQTLTVKLDPAGGLAETGSDLSSVVPGIAILVLAAGVGLLGLQRRRSSADAL
ncbi:DUF7507 domain-containing protein [Mycetocola saprophilus]|uniref:DUF7507 domain-containing protein n=1 Tax=Mycetocola saprophilus TaxID=76636 RepID=UPI0004C09A85|nr:hypothetical protein [Mycetocola saprophilus]